MHPVSPLCIFCLLSCLPPEMCTWWVSKFLRLADAQDEPAEVQSFGAQLFPGATPADNRKEPHQYVPEGWLQEFAGSGLGAAVWAGLFTGSAASRHFTLQFAPKATLLLDCGPGQQPQYAELGKALAKRNAGGKHTAVRISLHPAEQPPAEAGLLAFLAQHGAGVSELHYTFQSHKRFLDPPKQEVQASIPPPPNLPRLCSVSVSLKPISGLDIGQKQEQFIRDASAYLPQLTSLSLIWGDARKLWHLVFAAGTLATNLTHFTTDANLDDWLVGLLISHAPNLTHLTVGYVGECERHTYAYTLVATDTPGCLAEHGASMCMTYVT